MKVACQFSNSSGFKVLRVNGFDKHCHSDVLYIEPGVYGTEISCFFPVSMVFAGSFTCYSEFSDPISFNITVFSDECDPLLNSRNVATNSTVTSKCIDGFICPGCSRPFCKLQLDTNIETNHTHLSSHWVPMLTSDCIANICECN